MVQRLLLAVLAAQLTSGTIAQAQDMARAEYAERRARVMNTLLTANEQAYILRDAGARVLLVHSSLLASAREALADAPGVDHVIGSEGEGDDPFVTYESWISEESAGLSPADTFRTDAGTLNYSSGTTGRPKGIFHSHQDYALTSQLWGVDILGLRADDRTFSVAKLFFTYGLGGNLIFPWFVGASVAPYAGSPRIAKDVLGVIDRFRPTVLFNAPTGYASMLAVDDFTTVYDLTSLRVGVSRR